MTLNASGRAYRVWVCLPTENETTGLEVTQYCSGDSGGFLTLTVERLGDDGLIRTSGELNLCVPKGVDTLNPRYNPTRWSVGNYVIIHIADEAGTLRECPINRLRISKEVVPPYPGHWELNIQLACILTTKDSIKPIETPPGTAAVSRSNVYSGLGSQLGIEALGDLPGATFAGYEPDPDRTIVDQIGEIAIGGGGGVWMSAQGILRTIRIDFEPEYRLFLHEVGIHDVDDYEPIVGSIRPASDLTVVSEKPTNVIDADEKDKNKRSGCEKTIIPMSKSAIVDGETSTDEITAIIRKNCWQWTGNRYEETETEQRVRGLIVDEGFYTDFLPRIYPGFVSGGNAYGMMACYEKVEEKIFESSKEGRLLQTTATMDGAPGLVLLDYYKKTLTSSTTLPNLFDPIPLERTETTYDYQAYDYGKDTPKDSKGQVRRIKTVIYKPRAEIAGAATDWQPGVNVGHSDLAPYEVRTQSWHRRDRETWVYKIRTLRAGQIRSGTIKQFLALRTVKGESDNAVIISRNGSVQPPAAERRVEREGGNAINPMGQTLKGKASADADTREKELNYNYLDSDEHATRVAQMLIRLDNCRRYGDRITTIFLDEYFYYRPYVRIDIQYDEDHIFTTLIDQLTISMASNQVAVICECMATAEVTEGDAV